MTDDYSLLIYFSIWVLLSVTYFVQELRFNKKIEHVEKLISALSGDKSNVADQPQEKQKAQEVLKKKIELHKEQVAKSGAYNPAKDPVKQLDGNAPYTYFD